MSRRPFKDQFDSLHAAATAVAGHRDFGPRDYETGMRVLLAAIDDGPALNDTEYATAQKVVVNALSGRLAAQAGWNASPEVLGRTIVKPLIVIGVPRTGTTAMHKLLSLDPQFQGLERWLIGAPMPRPPRETWASHPLYQETEKGIAAYREAAPKLAAAHSSEAWEPDECLPIMAHSFCSNYFGSVLDVPAYDAWYLAQDETPVFRRHADILKLVGRDDPRPWLLKNPSHLLGLEGMLNAFPDASVVWTHRHPAKSIASLKSLLGGIRDISAGRPIDRAQLERREIGIWSEAVRRGMAAQDRRPDRFVNVRQEETRADPLGVVERIYDKFGLTLSPEGRAAMQAFAAANPPDGNFGHDYAPVEDDGPIEQAFGDYIARYGLAQPVGVQ